MRQLATTDNVEARVLSSVRLHAASTLKAAQAALAGAAYCLVGARLAEARAPGTVPSASGCACQQPSLSAPGLAPLSDIKHIPALPFPLLSPCPARPPASPN